MPIRTFPDTRSPVPAPVHATTDRAAATTAPAPDVTQRPYQLVLTFDADSTSRPDAFAALFAVPFEYAPRTRPKKARAA